MTRRAEETAALPHSQAGTRPQRSGLAAICSATGTKPVARLVKVCQRTGGVQGPALTAIEEARRPGTASGSGRAVSCPLQGCGGRHRRPRPLSDIGSGAPDQPCLSIVATAQFAGHSADCPVRMHGNPSGAPAATAPRSPRSSDISSSPERATDPTPGYLMASQSPMNGWPASQLGQTMSHARCQPCRACIAATAPGWWSIASMNSHSSTASPA
jgi:hypothetical protein